MCARRVAGIEDLIEAVEARLTAKLCSLQNALSDVHNTLNHVQRLLLVPEGSRPGE